MRINNISEVFNPKIIKEDIRSPRACMLRIFYNYKYSPNRGRVEKILNIKID
jgi:hypothetical protein